VSEREHPVPPPGEEIHLPGPTFIPIFCAVGITLAVIGTTISPIIVVVGLLIFLGTTIRWIRDTRRDIDSLPSEH
jgi:Flp pilus assembly protein TadB